MDRQCFDADPYPDPILYCDADPDLDMDPDPTSSNTQVGKEEICLLLFIAMPVYIVSSYSSVP